MHPAEFVPIVWHSPIRFDQHCSNYFKGGLTAGAVSMRERAVRVATEAMKDVGDETLKVLNELNNKIGQLSDIEQ